MLILTGVFDGHAWIEGDVLGDARFDLFNKSAQIAVAHIRLHKYPEAAIFRRNFTGPNYAFNFSDLPQRHMGPSGSGNEEITKFVDVIAIGLLESHL